MKKIRINCEFGSELVFKVAEVYHEWKKDSKIELHTFKGMAPFYFYMNKNDIIEKDVKRGLGSPFGVKLHAKELPSYCNEYPNFKEKYSTYKLPFGHRGLNHPCGDNNKIEITSQNHGFAVDPSSLSKDLVTISHYNLNDNTVAGLEVNNKPIFSVQYHPEAGPGPHDSDYLFKKFVSLMLERC